MAGSIGPIAAGIAPPPVIRRNAEPAPEAARSAQAGQRTGADILTQATARPAGDGGAQALSGPGAALVTIERNVESVRQLVPNLEEVRARIRVRNTELRQAQSAEVRDEFNDAAREIVRTTPEAAPQVSRLYGTASTEAAPVAESTVAQESNAVSEPVAAPPSSSNESVDTDLTETNSTAPESDVAQAEASQGPDLGPANSTERPESAVADDRARRPAQAAPVPAQPATLDLLA